MVTISELVLSIIDREEPQYGKALALPADAIPVLAELAAGKDVRLAAAAVSLAGRTGYAEAIGVLEIGAAREEDAIRVAAAGALRDVRSPRSDALIEKLLDDPYVSVRKFALRSAALNGSGRLKFYIAHVQELDPEPQLRKLAGSMAEEDREGGMRF